MDKSQQPIPPIHFKIKRRMIHPDNKEGGIVSLSGGMDSATVYAMAIQKHGPANVQPVFFLYGSKHNEWERFAAHSLVNHYRTKHKGITRPLRIIDLTPIFSQFNSNLLESGGPIPEGHYEQKNMEQTVVPSRNIIFISYLSGLAWTLGFSTIWLGVHNGDHAVYADCRAEFIDPMTAAIEEGTDGRIMMQSPFLFTNKKGILAWGLRNEVPYELTRTCYKNQPVACGKCGSCQERLEAFIANSHRDPIACEFREILPKEE